MRDWRVYQHPLKVTWNRKNVAESTVTLPAMTQAILINPETCCGCLD